MSSSSSVESVGVLPESYPVTPFAKRLAEVNLRYSSEKCYSLTDPLKVQKFLDRNADIETCEDGEPLTLTLTKSFRVKHDTKNDYVNQKQKEGASKTIGAYYHKRMSYLQVEKLCAEAIVPKRATAGSAGYDLTSVSYLTIPPRARGMISTGLRITVPEGCYGRIAPRSSLAMKGIDVLAGVIDADYRGEVNIILVNLSEIDFYIKAGDRVAQLVLERIHTPPVLCVNDNSIHAESDEERIGGFGSTNT